MTKSLAALHASFDETLNHLHRQFSEFELGRIWVGVTTLRHLIALRQMEEQKGQSAESAPVLVQSGLTDAMWRDAMECRCYLRNIHDSLVDAQSACQKNDPLRVSVVPSYQWELRSIINPYCERKKTSSSSAWKENASRRYALHTVGEWTGKIISVPENTCSHAKMDLSLSSSRLSKNVQDTSSLKLSIEGNFKKKTLQQRATSKQAVTSHKHLMLSNVKQRRTMMTSGACLGDSIYRHRVARQLYVPKTVIVPKYIDVHKQTKTHLDNLEESSIDDDWNVDCNRTLSKNGSVSIVFILSEPITKCYLWVTGSIGEQTVEQIVGEEIVEAVNIIPLERLRQSTMEKFCRRGSSSCHEDHR